MRSGKWCPIRGLIKATNHSNAFQTFCVGRDCMWCDTHWDYDEEKKKFFKDGYQCALAPSDNFIHVATAHVEEDSDDE